MGKAKRKINRLRRKMIKKGFNPRIPIAPPSVRMKTKKDYNRANNKKAIKENLDD